jgi:hypothetical protein
LRPFNDYFLVLVRWGRKQKPRTGDKAQHHGTEQKPSGTRTTGASRMSRRPPPADHILFARFGICPSFFSLEKHG